MKKLVLIVAVVVFSSVVTSCGTTLKTNHNHKEIAGYTLKSKSQLLEQKILNTTTKKVIVNP